MDKSSTYCSRPCNGQADSVSGLPRTLFPRHLIEKCFRIGIRRAKGIEIRF